MQVLITGCNGQVGQALVNLYNSRSDVTIQAVDRAELDITDRDAVLRAVQDFQPNIIINAAAHTAVDKAETDIEMSYAINELGPQYLAEGAKEVNAILLHISTDYVFAGDKQGLYQEDDPVAPQGVYGMSKLAGERAVAQYAPHYAILRTAWVFGEAGNNFVKTMLRLGKERDELGIVADQYGGPTYATDIAKALIRMADEMFNHPKNDYNGIYHFSGAPHVSWYEFAQTIFTQAVQQQLLSKAPLLKGITTEDYPTPAKRPANSKLNTQKISDVFGIQASDWQLALNNLNDYQG